MGTHGMPRRYATYMPEYQIYHILSSIGAFLQMGSLLLVAAVLIYSLWRGRRAPANPWGGSTLEWECASPPPFDNFETTPKVGSPYDHTSIVWNAKLGGYVRKG